MNPGKRGRAGKDRLSRISSKVSVVQSLGPLHIPLSLKMRACGSLKRPVCDRILFSGADHRLPLVVSLAGRIECPYVEPLLLAFDAYAPFA